MLLPPRPPQMKRRLILGLSLLGALLSTSCASNVRTVLAPIPVAAEWRQPCEAAVQPADPVTPSASLQFGEDAIVEARCWKTIATGAIGAMDEHNARAETNE